MEIRTRTGTLLSALLLVSGFVVLSFSSGARGTPAALNPIANGPLRSELGVLPDAQAGEGREGETQVLPLTTTEAISLFDLRADLNPLRQPLSEPPANPPPAPLYAPGESPADDPVASHLTRRGWPNTTAQTTLAPRAKKPPTLGKWIDVNISRQTVTAYIGAKPIKTVLTSTGTRLHPTVTGTYKVYAKVPSQTMTGGSRAAGDYYRLPGVPNIMYFYQGYALHGTYWHRNFGHPMSHGCVNLTLADAAWFFTWTPMRTIVRPHY